MLLRYHLKNVHFEMEADAQTSEVLSVLDAFVVFYRNHLHAVVCKSTF